MRIVRNGSICLIGFHVRRPSCNAVGSPCFVRDNREEQNGRYEQYVLEGIHVRKIVVLNMSEVKVLP
jgi:hypothetical protein